MIKDVFIGCDHGGFALKEDIMKFLSQMGYDYVDFGCYDSHPVDYPDIASLVAEAVAEQENSVGILIDGAGIGSAMVANKVPGIRCALCWDISSAVNSREHNNSNIIAIGGQFIGVGLARQIVKTWLETPFSGGRHERRVTKIMEVESRYSKRYRS